MEGGESQAWIFWAILLVLGGGVGLAAWWKRTHSSIRGFDDEPKAKTNGK